MVFRKYHPSIKVVAVRMHLQNYDRETIRKALGETISRQSFDRWLELYQETRRVVHDPESYQTRGRPTLLSDEDREFMIELVRTEPGLFLDEIRQRLYDQNETFMCLSGIHHNLVECLRITLKKAHVVSINKSLLSKYKWIEEMQTIPAEFLVFTDESAICSRDLLRYFARSQCGSNATCTRLEQNFKRFNVVPAISFYGLLAISVSEGTIKARNFEEFLKWTLLPRMNRYPNVNSVLVLDNAPIHKGPGVLRLCHEAGVKVWYLPPYCPELNPIEMCFSQLKSHLRRTQGLTLAEDPILVIRTTAVKVITQSLCEKLYRHCHYNCPSPTDCLRFDEMYN